MNPPYKAANDGVVSDDKEKSGANHEVFCTFEDICNAAAKLLRETEMPIDDIIKNVGYTNGGFFRAAFKERYGMNLLEYRKGVTGKTQ